MTRPSSTAVPSPWRRGLTPLPGAEGTSGSADEPERFAIRGGPASPQAGVQPPAAAQRLASFVPSDEGLADPARVWVVGAHGGAGETTLAGLLEGAIGTGRRWPTASTVPALLVARTHAAGLVAAQQAVRTWAAGVAGADVLGLVFVPDGSGRLPRVLADQVKVITGGVAHAWLLCWSEDLRLGQPHRPDRAWQRFDAELSRALERPALALTGRGSGGRERQRSRQQASERETRQ